MLFKERFKEETLLCRSSLSAVLHEDPSFIVISSPDRREDEPKPINNDNQLRSVWLAAFQLSHMHEISNNSQIYLSGNNIAKFFMYSC